MGLLFRVYSDHTHFYVIYFWNFSLFGLGFSFFILLNNQGGDDTCTCHSTCVVRVRATSRSQFSQSHKFWGSDLGLLVKHLYLPSYLARPCFISSREGHVWPRLALFILLFLIFLLSLWSAVIRDVYHCKPFQCIKLTARHLMAFFSFGPIIKQNLCGIQLCDC